MKKNEVAILILVVSLVAMLTYFSVNAIIGKAGSKPVSVEVAEPISEDVVQPSDTIFNPSAINPTVKVKIGDQSGQQPFTISQ